MLTKVEVEVFDGKCDFLLWRKNIRVVLFQITVPKAIDNSYATGKSDDKKHVTDEIAMITIILHLSKMVLQKVDEVKTIAEVWSKFEQL